MSRLAATVLALGLCAATGVASAQTRTYDDRGMDRGGVFYDEAPVIRVDPVFDDGDDRYGDDRYTRDPYGRDAYSRDAYGGGYRTGGPTPSQRCYTRDEGYVDGYGGDRYGGGYPSDPYGGGGARPQGSETGRTVATVVGGVVGAVLGSQVGGGSGRYATSAIGTMVGSMAGRGIYDANQRQRRAQVTVCDPEPYAGDRGYGDDGYRGINASGVRWYDVTYEYGGRRHVTRTDYHPGDTIRVRVDVSAD